MPIVQINIPPGVRDNGTADQSEMRWERSSLIRWSKGEMTPVGGFEQDIYSKPNGTTRKALAWVVNDGSKWLAAASSDVVTVSSEAGTPYTITPTDLFSSPNTKPANDDYEVFWGIFSWGQNLVMCNNVDGRIYEWQYNANSQSGDEAKRITTANGYTNNAPTDCQNIFVTEERFLFALGADGDAAKVSWSDREDLGTWAASSINEAGDLNLDTEGRLSCGVSFNGKTVILGTTDCFAATYIGPPYVYGFEKVGSDCGIISQNAAVSTPIGVVWMGQKSFYVYDGGRVRSLRCDVNDSVFNDFSTTEDYLKCIWAFHNAEFNEVWWFYPRNNGQDARDNGSYVVYNYVENTWTIGGDDVPGSTPDTPQYSGLSRLPRTAGVGPDVLGRTIWYGNVVYEHEIAGGDFIPFTGDAPYAFAMSAPFYASPQKNIVTATQMMQDVENSTGSEFWMYSKNYPNQAEIRTPASGSGNYALANPTDIRVTGRQFRLVLQMDDGQSTKAGSFMLNVQENGTR